jgi:hypothetical protein
MLCGSVARSNRSFDTDAQVLQFAARARLPAAGLTPTLGLKSSMRQHAYAPLALALAVVLAPAFAQVDVWREMLRATRYADTVRARLAYDCRTNSAYVSTAALRGLCARFPDIPDRVIELATLPYARLHVSSTLAERAIAFWGSEPGMRLSRKMIAEIETGTQDQLSEDESSLLRERNQSDFGQALLALADDRDAGIAVARAMLAYEP